MEENTSLESIRYGNDIFVDSCKIIDTAKKVAYTAVDTTLTERNWLLGKRIDTEILSKNRAENYGKELIKDLAEKLTNKYGKGFTKTSVYYFLEFYRAYPDIFQSPTGKSLLSWTHYTVLLQLSDKEARDWYENEAISENWGVKTLQRNVASQYYYRMLKTQKKELVRAEMIEKTSELDDKNLEFVKNPVILEFLGLEEDNSYLESDLERVLLLNLRKFLMELGKGYAFIGSQQRVHTEKEDYYIDLVFYNYILKCFVLIDLKTSKVTHQDVGQMDMYVRLYDEYKKGEGDNPTIGILLCSETDEDIARYSVMNDNDQLFASKYKLYLPTKEELKKEIEIQKTMYELKQKDNNIKI